MLSPAEPFAGLFTQGMVTHETYRRRNGDWVDPSSVELRTEGSTRQAFDESTGEPLVIGDFEKMSKSKRNVVAPADIADAYGIDAARLFVLSDSPPERDVLWTSAGVEGAWRLINRVWTEFDTDPGDFDPFDIDSLRRATHRTVKAITDAVEGFRFNSAIARLYEFVAVLRNCRAPAGDAHRIDARREALSALARLISPFAPHLAAWPAYDPLLTREDEVVLPVQINGKRRGEIRAPAGASDELVRERVLADPDIALRLEGLVVRKVIVVKDRIVNLVAG
jgi:leucyl-tRNA synthetase